MQTENSNINLCEKIHCIMQTENSNINKLVPKIYCIMQTENSNRNLSRKYIVLCKLKSVTETCLKNTL